MGPAGKFFERAFEWFWQGHALQTARAARAADSNRVAYERARVAAEVAEQVLAPPGPWFTGNAHHLAAALFIESIGWALRAIGALRPSAETGQVAFEGPPRHDELEELFVTCEPVLLQAAAGRQGLEQLRAHALRREFESTAQGAEEIEQVARTLSQVARRLLASSSAAQSSVDSPMLRRMGHMLVLVLVVVGGNASFGFVRDQLERRADLAAGKAWRASSSAESVCQSPQHRCGLRKPYFFHTNEEQSPWLEIDLARPEQFSRVHVFNRRDCCSDRAVPLLVEVSSDRVTWRELVRTSEMFDDWRAAFQPVTARWVRLRVARRSFLHLNDVRVLK